MSTIDIDIPKMESWITDAKALSTKLEEDINNLNLVLNGYDKLWTDSPASQIYNELLTKYSTDSSITVETINDLIYNISLSLSSYKDTENDISDKLNGGGI